MPSLLIELYRIEIGYLAAVLVARPLLLIELYRIEIAESIFMKTEYLTFNRTL